MDHVVCRLEVMVWFSGVSIASTFLCVNLFFNRVSTVSAAEISRVGFLLSVASMQVEVVFGLVIVLSKGLKADVFQRLCAV